MQGRSYLYARYARRAYLKKSRVKKNDKKLGYESE